MLKTVGVIMDISLHLVFIAVSVFVAGALSGQRLLARKPDREREDIIDKLFEENVSLKLQLKQRLTNYER